METVRVDKWLWAARCFKTRTQATTACDAGHVMVNGVTAKPARQVRPEDVIQVRLPSLTRVFRVLALHDRRGPAPEAQALYEDLTPPPPPRETPVAARERGTGRPTKKDRRLIERMFEEET